MVAFLNIKKQYQEIKDDVMEKISDIFDKCCFIGGEYVNTFEKEAAEYLGVKHAVSCGNGTDALVLALKACGVEPGDEVITTSFSFFATAEAISSVGAIPVFVDIKEKDFLIDEERIEYAVTSKTKAILPVQLFGCCCDMDKIMRIAKKYNLKVIEDDAQAIGSEYKGRKAGTLADVGCFSFYPTKNLGGAGDGGMCTTDNDDIANALRAYKEHGAGTTGRKAKEYLYGEKYEQVVNEKETDLYNPEKYYNYLIGYNSRLDALQAAVLSVKLRRLDGYNDRRTEIAERYIDKLTKKVICPIYGDDTKPCWHQFVIKTDKKEELCKYLSEKGIGNGTFYPVPLHKQKAFNRKNSITEMPKLSIADEMAEQTVCLPIYPELTDEEVDTVIETVNKFFGEG